MNTARTGIINIAKIVNSHNGDIMRERQLTFSDYEKREIETSSILAPPKLANFAIAIGFYLCINMLLGYGWTGWLTGLIVYIIILFIMSEYCS
jgi:hypothetical protein